MEALGAFGIALIALFATRCNLYRIRELERKSDAVENVILELVKKYDQMDTSITEISFKHK